MVYHLVDFSDREYLVGNKHSRGRDINYDRTPEDDRLIEWSKAVDLLTINEAFRLKVKLQKVEGEQSKEIARLKGLEGQQSQEIARLKAELKDVQKRTSAIGEMVTWVKTHYNPDGTKTVTSG